MEESQPAKALDSQLVFPDNRRVTSDVYSIWPHSHQDKPDAGNSFNGKELSCSLESLDTPQKPISQQKAPNEIGQSTSEASLPLDDNESSLEFPDFPAFPL